MVAGSPTATGSVALKIFNPSGLLVFSDAVALQSNGAFNDTFHAGVNGLWTSGNYTVSASWSTASTSSQFAYTAAVSSTTSTITVTTTSVTTLTNATTTETVTQTGSAQAIPSWAYAVILFLMVASLFVGYLARLFLFERKAKLSGEQ